MKMLEFKRTDQKNYKASSSFSDFEIETSLISEKKTIVACGSLELEAPLSCMFKVCNNIQSFLQDKEFIQKWSLTECFLVNIFSHQELKATIVDGSYEKFIRSICTYFANQDGVVEYTFTFWRYKALRFENSYFPFEMIQELNSQECLLDIFSSPIYRERALRLQEKQKEKTLQTF